MMEDVFAENLQGAVTTEILMALAARRMNRRELAGRMGWEPVRLYRKINGQTPLTLGEVEEIATALNLPVGRLFGAVCAAMDSNPEPADYEQHLIAS